jgi:hypothetical protein
MIRSFAVVITLLATAALFALGAVASAAWGEVDSDLTIEIKVETLAGAGVAASWSSVTSGER